MIRTQPKIILASFAVVAVGLCMIYGLLWLVSTPRDGMFQVGSTSFSWQFIPLFGAIVLWNISWLWFTVTGFRTHWGWGLGILIFPVASVAFLFIHPQRVKHPTFLWLSGAVLLLIVMISTP